MNQAGSTARFGRYELRGTLGEGGFATVYRAWDPALGREIALKALFPHLAANADMRRRFVAEAGALARLRHPNIVTVFDVGEADGRPFFAMELVEGQTLAALAGEGRGQNVQGVVEIMVALAKAVDHLHSKGVVHRDIKADNVMVERSGRVVLMDFGIARMLDQTQHTRTGVVMGSIETMAPEQVRGQTVGPPADIYALGVLAYQLLAGRPPFTGDTARVLYGHAHEPPPPLQDLRPGLPAPVYRAVEAALAKDPLARPPTGRTLVEPIAVALGRSASSTPEIPEQKPSDACPACKGTGRVRRVQQSIFGQFENSAPCRRCGGTGRVGANEPGSSGPSPRPEPRRAGPERLRKGQPRVSEDEQDPPLTGTARFFFWTAVVITIVALAYAYAGSIARHANAADLFSPKAHGSASHGPTRAPTPEKLATTVFTVNGLPVGCHAAPNASATIDTMLPSGTIQSMDLKIGQSDGTWEHDADRLCWTRTNPGPLQTYQSFSQAVDAASKVPHKPGEVILADSLDNPGRGILPKQSSRPSCCSMGYADGEYRVVRPSECCGDASFALPGNYTNVSVDFDAQVVGNTTDVWIALDCLPPGARDGHAFPQVTPDGRGGHFSDVTGNGTGVVPGTFFSMNTPIGNQPFHLDLTCVGDALAASVNRAQAASTRDPTYRGGPRGIVVSIFGSGRADVRLRNLVVTQR